MINLGTTCPEDVQKALLRQMKLLEQIGKRTGSGGIEGRSLVRTNQGHLEKKAQSNLDDKTCGTGNIVGN